VHPPQCPHQNRCPRYHLDTVPCNFDAKFKNFQLDCLPHDIREIVSTDKYSYVVFRKGPRYQSSSCSYPRLMEQPLMKTGHTLCRLCTNRGRLEEVMVTKSKQKLV
jgi:ribosomal protein RSM22 (predicted rRNA methylase)